ncbi:MAG: hypothetical protein U0667_05745 [Chloroflexota bacterium]
MRRFVPLLTAIALAVPAAAVAQSPSAAPPSAPRTVCVTLTGTDAFLTPVTLTSGISDGTITVTEVSNDCASAQMSPEPTIEATDAHQPAVITETALRLDDDYAYGVALISNPNTDWVLGSVSVDFDFLDSKGDLVTTESDSITLLPGQTAAATVSTSGAEGTKKIAVTLGDDEDDWTQIDEPTGDVTFSQVKSKRSSYSLTTTGRATSSFADDQSYVELTAIYRNKKGKIIGSGRTYLEEAPAGSTKSFKLYADGDVSKPASTEMTYQLSGF